MKERHFVAGVIGKDGRTSAIRQRLEESPRIAGPVVNLTPRKGLGPSAQLDDILQKAHETRPDFVVVGPEDPLARGIVDRLDEIGIPAVGPRRALAQLEASKTFTRQLLAAYEIPGNPAHRIFTGSNGIAEYLHALGDFVIKPDGLTGGKGVKVSGDHLASVADGLAYCDELLQSGHARVIVEEKLEGEEFSLQSFCDGTHVVHTVPVQDHKRAFEGDTGPNTGGMGTYSDADHLLPFLNRSALEDAQSITERVAQALLAETGHAYKGVLFGGFMLTRAGVRLLEYNARFGDPEALNVLSILQSDFAEICLAIIRGSLHEVDVSFRNLATVCKYVVPQGYPDRPVKGESIDMRDVPAESENLQIFHAAVEEQPDGRLMMTGSRAVAFVGIGPDLASAERHAEAAASAVRGPVFHRKDIGSASLIERRVAHIERLHA